MKIVKQENNKIEIELANGARVEVEDSKTNSLGNSVRVISKDYESKIRGSKIYIDLEGNVKENVIFANFKGNFAKNKDSFLSRFSGKKITTTDLRPNILNRWGLKEDSICTVHHK
jgi:hypothetical protein